LGWVGHAAAEDFSADDDDISGLGACFEELAQVELRKGATDALCDSFHAMICARMDTLGKSVLLSKCSLVVGDVEWDESHSVIDDRSYVKPSAATTGSCIRSHENAMSQSWSAKREMKLERKKERRHDGVKT